MKKFKTFQLAVDSLGSTETIYHEIIWYIERELTFEEWIALDDAQSQAFESVGISLDDVIGMAGPIPFPPKETDENEGSS